MCEAFIKLCLGRENFSYEGSGVYPVRTYFYHIFFLLN